MSLATIAQPARPPLPLRAEIGRQLRRRRTIGIFAVLTVLPLVLLLAFWLGDGDGDSGERGFVDLAQESGANLVIFTLFASTSFLLDRHRRLVRRRYRPLGSELGQSALPAGRSGTPRAPVAAEARRGGTLLGGRFRLPARLDAGRGRHRVRLGSLCRPDRKPDRLAGIRGAALDHRRLPAAA